MNFCCFVMEAYGAKVSSFFQDQRGQKDLKEYYQNWWGMILKRSGNDSQVSLVSRQFTPRQPSKGPSAPFRTLPPRQIVSNEVELRQPLEEPNQSLPALILPTKDLNRSPYNKLQGKKQSSP